MNNPNDIDLEKRLDYLEQANFFKMTALGLSKELGEFHSSLNRLEDPGIVFDKCRARASQIIHFKQMAFFLVDENDSDFTLYKCYPEDNKNRLEREMDILIDDGTFSRALMEKKPITAYTKDFRQQLLLHVLTTVSRVRGMFVGILETNAKHIPEASFELFSILMAHCANTLESFELYQQLRKSNEQLKEKVRQLSVSESSLKHEIGQHEKTETALKLSEKQYRLLAETAKEVIFMVAPDQQIIYSNPSAQKISGYPMNVVTTLKINHLIDNFNEVMADNKRYFSSVHAVRLSTESGDLVPLEINLAPVSIADDASGILIVGRDISQRLRADEEKKYLEEKLWQAQKMESIGLLASGIAHDFNNILSVIVNFTSLSISTLGENSPVYPHLKKVQTASNRAVQLARKLYTIGRSDDHQKHIINIVYTIKETIDLLSSSLGRNIVVKTDCKVRQLKILAEETRIQQILMNLITNAAYSMTDKRGTIIVSADRTTLLDEKSLLLLDLEPGSYIKLSVSDDGPGIDSDSLQRVFEPYFSTKKGPDNSGLGLAVVHGIVKNYNGAIDIHTLEGEGTTFHIYLPEAKQSGRGT